jgi:hypothetical protein
MRFAPEEAVDLWQSGTYDYEVREATEATSQAGNDMTKLEVWIYNKSGQRRLIFDYLVAGEKTAWKIRSFAESCGLMQQYKSGELTTVDIVGRTGICQVDAQEESGAFPARNIIRSYVKMKNDPQSAAEPTARRSAKEPVGRGIIDDEIPF